jgi:hypothetical protein
MNLGELFFKLFVFFSLFIHYRSFSSLGLRRYVNLLCLYVYHHQPPLIPLSYAINAPIRLMATFFSRHTIPLISGPFFLQKYCIATNSIPPVSG